MGRGCGVRVRARLVVVVVTVAGLLGVAGVESANALGPPLLLTVTVSPTAASVAQGQAQQFTATGHYSDLSTANLTDSVTWSSSSSSVATISNSTGSQGKGTAIGVGAATITATDPSSLIKGTAVLTVTPAILVAVTVAPTVASVAKGDTEQFAATGHYSNLSTVNLTNSVTWSSSSSSVATISNSTGSQGKATATGVGAATVTATDPSSLISGTAALTVTAATLVSVSVAPVAASVAKGETEQFAATGLYSDLSTADLTDSVTWSSSSSSVATISNSPGSQGKATATGVGAATITAIDPSSLISGTAVFTVTPAVLTAITVSPTLASVAKGNTEQFSATGVYSDLSTANLTDSVTWSSSSSSVTTVSNSAGSQGKATATGVGAATITATDPSSLISGTAAFTVLPAVLTAITVSPAVASVAKGDTEQFTATGVYSDLSTADLTNSVTWSSSSSSVATVSNSAGSQGKATAAGVGGATITATDPSSLISGTAALTVLPAVLTAVTVSPSLTSVAKGQSEQFAATGLYSDGTTKDLTSSVTWSSLQGSLASISNAVGTQGLATGLLPGVSTINATDPSSLLSGTAALTVLPAVLTAVTVSPTLASVAKGQSEQFAATGLYSDGTTKDLTSSVTWSSLQGSLASISNAGLATGLLPGVSTINATDPASLLSGTAALTVLPAMLTAVTVTPALASVAQGQTQQFSATGLYSDGTTKDLTSSVTWSSLQGSLASISNAVGSQGLATGLLPGVSTINATDPASLLSGTAALTVLPAVLTAITVSPALTSVTQGQTQQFSATGLYSDGTTRDLTNSVTWSSLQGSLASISNAVGSQGLATGLLPGVSTINATDPSSLISGTAALTVLPAVLTAITVTPALSSVTQGQTQQFSATGLYSNGTTQDLTNSVTWSSAQGLLATISNAVGSQGLATGVLPGLSTITATDPTTLIGGSAVLSVLSALDPPPSNPPSSPLLSLTPGSGKKRSAVTSTGTSFVPGGTVIVTYLSGLRAKKRASTVLCQATVATNGTFSCGGTIPRASRSGKKGKHTIAATESSAAQGTTIFTLLR